VGSAVGTSPGRLVETDAKGNIIHEWPEDVEGTVSPNMYKTPCRAQANFLSQLNILGEQFSPHGLSVDFENNLILTSDYVVPLSILKPTTGIIKAETLRLWDLEKREIISTIRIPEVSYLLSTPNIPSSFLRVAANN
jgi:selenium-binding protein 1